MTETLPDEAGTMPGLGPVPLLQRQSASNSRWTRTVPMASAALFVFGAILAHLVLQQAGRGEGLAGQGGWHRVTYDDGGVDHKGQGGGSASGAPLNSTGTMVKPPLGDSSFRSLGSDQV